VTHYCALHDSLICEECLQYSHALHADRHISNVKNQDIERQINEIKGDLKMVEDRVKTVLEDIEKYRQR
jgi:hypothetical protein